MAKCENYFKGKRKNGCLLKVRGPSARSAINLSSHSSQTGSCFPSLPLNMPQSPPVAAVPLPGKNMPRHRELACSCLGKRRAKHPPFEPSMPCCLGLPTGNSEDEVPLSCSRTPAAGRREGFLEEVGCLCSALPSCLVTSYQLRG